jgi:hypothetical protein
MSVALLNVFQVLDGIKEELIELAFLAQYAPRKVSEVVHFVGFHFDVGQDV